MNLKRILTTIIGIPIVVLTILFANEYIIGGIVLIASIICMYEYFNAIKKVCKPIHWIGYLSNIIIIGATAFSSDFLQSFLIYYMPIVLLLLFLQVIFTNMKINFKDVAYTFLGTMYIPFFLMFIEVIRKMENGKILIGYLFIISWATDIFAYLIGKHFGKIKFSKISPNKTVEGSISGIIGTVVFISIYTCIMNKFCNTDYSYIMFIIMGIILSSIGQIGDFVASIVKRFVDVKDYSNLLPGHGGMLDRIDSLLFIAPFAYMFFNYLI